MTNWERIQQPFPGKTSDHRREQPRQPIVRGSGLVVDPLRVLRGAI